MSAINSDRSDQEPVYIVKALKPDEEYRRLSLRRKTKNKMKGIRKHSSQREDDNMDARGALEDDHDIFIVQVSVRKLVYNNKESLILILRNTTNYFKWKTASGFVQSMRMLTSTVSHEMRLPLESIVSMCAILLKWVNEQRIIKQITAIRICSKILLSRTNDLLDNTTLDKGTFKPHLSVFDPC